MIKALELIFPGIQEMYIYIYIFIKGIPLIDEEQNANNSFDQT